MDSYYVGDMGDDDLGDLLGDDDLGDLLGDDEMGRRRKRVQRVAKRHGMVAVPKATLQSAISQARQQAVHKANATGIPQTIGGKLATSDQRLEVLPLGSVTLALALGSTATLSVNVQRPIQPYRLILQAADITTGADQLFSVGMSNIVLGSHNLYASPGIIAPGTGFGRDAWGTEILSIPMTNGGIVNVQLQRIAAVANNSVVTGMLFGYSAAT